MKKIETLVKDIYSAIDKGFSPTSEAMEDFLDSVSHAITKQFSSEQRKDRNTLRMSNLGRPECQLWYEVNGSPREQITPDTRIKFLFGDLIEALLIFLVKEAGHEVTHEQAEVQVDGIVGHTDCKIDSIPVDIKSASSYAFKKFKDGTLADDDPFGYLAQISAYAHAEGSTKGGFLAMDKQRGSITYMPVDEMDMINVPKRIKHLKEIVKSKTPPKRCFKSKADGKSGNMKLDVNCSYCSFKDTCWSDANDGDGLRLFLYSNGPRWLTHVEREPDVYEVTG